MCVRTTSTHHSINRSIDHCRCSKIHMYSEFRSCMHYSLICSSLALLAMDRSMHDSSVRPPGMLPTCMLLGGSKNTWMHACMCMGRINNKWPCTGLHEIPATWYCTDSTASYDYVAPSFSFYLLSRLDQGVIVSREWRFFILGQNREWHLCHILLIIYSRMGWSMPMIDVPYQYQAVY